MLPSFVSRAVSNTVRRPCCIRPKVPLTFGAKRAASSKHPKGFVPPATEELAELRDRVQEFTRMILTSHFATRRKLINEQGERFQKSLLRKRIEKMSFQTICGRSLERQGGPPVSRSSYTIFRLTVVKIPWYHR